MKTKTPPPPSNLLEQVRWWRKQAFADDKGGSFDLDLFINYLRVKLCTDYTSTQAED